MVQLLVKHFTDAEGSRAVPAKLTQRRDRQGGSRRYQEQHRLEYSPLMPRRTRWGSLVQAICLVC